MVDKQKSDMVLFSAKYLVLVSNRTIVMTIVWISNRKFQEFTQYSRLAKESQIYFNVSRNFIYSKHLHKDNRKT